VTAFLRYIGIVNAALWLGADVFLIVGLPAIFATTAQFKTEMGPGGNYYVGLAAQRIFARFFILQYCCCGVGLAHLALEWLYSNKPLWQRNLAILAVLGGLALAGGLVMQPKLADLHHHMYYDTKPVAQDAARRAFKAWHGAAECVNLVTIGGLLVYLWRVSRSAGHARFESLNLDKIRG
jgi:hypothetical protein